MRREVTCAMVAVLLLTACACAVGESLWCEGARPLIADRRAARPGDVVTILVVERSVASHEASHNTDKKLEVSGGPGMGPLAFFPALSVKTERATAGTGATTQSTRLVDRISGLVKAVRPEGTLEIEAVRQVKLNRDEITLTVRGVVRPDDVAPDNTVLSTQIAECTIAWTGRGPIPDKQRPGIISALLSLLW